MKYTHRADAENIIEMYEETRAQGFGNEVKRRIMIGTYVLSSGYYDAYYLKAQKVRSMISQDFKEAFSKVDAIYGPSTPSTAFEIGDKNKDPLEMYLNDVFTVPVNLAGLPAISVPVGLDKENLPIGMQLIGNSFDEESILSIASCIEKSAKFDLTPKNGGLMNNLIKGETGDWEVVIGIEVHAQIISNSKLFSSASTKFGGEHNTQVSFVDAGMPGMLPVINWVCVEQAIRTGLGLNAKINNYSIFDRKNYFYPDLPQGYQISQYQQPVVGEGSVTIDLDDNNSKTIRIERLHLEQDAGKSLHDQHPEYSYVDLNRSGVALMEIVSMPDISSAEEAQSYIKN